MGNENEIADTPAAFLNGLGDALKAQTGVDSDLADVIIANLLTTAPAKDAVDQVYVAILALADKRAAPADEVADG